MSGRDWVAAARPRTLPAALSPVAVGIGVARAAGPVSVWRAALCFVVSLAVQIGTNYANDYSDGVRGTDARRVGPTRLVASGLATAAAVRLAAFASFGVGAAVGAVLAFSTSPLLLLAGAASIAAGWFYTGGRHPYGYAGYGEGFVFVFFGIVAVAGTVYVSCGHLPALAFVAAVPVGLLTVALLVVNNLRDIPNDAVSGKRTLAVRIGAAATRAFYAGLVVSAFAVLAAIASYRPAALIALGAALLAVRPVRRVLSGAEGPALIRALAETGTLQLAFGGLLAVGIAW
jgi:1,4-dihydroxy-2-naphthoate octaprenyltransferase